MSKVQMCLGITQSEPQQTKGYFLKNLDKLRLPAYSAKQSETVKSKV